jgi:hypothetical protein
MSNKKAYRSLPQQWPGFSSFVDDKSQRGLSDHNFEPNFDTGQDRLDSMWPQPKTNEREVERALPLPSDADVEGQRTKHIGPTTFNKPEVNPERTFPERGDEYGHPTKFDYNYIQRRNVTAEEELFLSNKEALRRETQGEEKRYHQRYIRRNAPRIRRKRLQYWNTRGKRDPKTKRRLRICDAIPSKCVTRGKSPFRTPAERTKAWREEQGEKAKRKGISTKDLARRREMARKAHSLAVEAAELLGFEIVATAGWVTQLKTTEAPHTLDQNYGEGLSQNPGSPRKDPFTQEGESLRAPNLTDKQQFGLDWEVEPRAPGGSYPIKTINNPGSGSGKVIPMWGDFVNNTQAIPDARQDRYLTNNNFDVKVAATMADILANVDPQIAQRAKLRPPKLVRTNAKDASWTFNSGQWQVDVRAFKNGSARSINDLNLKVSCTCPFWRWQGPEHWGASLDYQQGPPRGSAAFPGVRDPKHTHPVCKHVYSVLQELQKHPDLSKRYSLEKLGSQYFLDKYQSVEVEFVTFSRAAQIALGGEYQKVIDQVVERYLANRN